MAVHTTFSDAQVVYFSIVPVAETGHRQTLRTEFFGQVFMKFS